MPVQVAEAKPKSKPVKVAKAKSKPARDAKAPAKPKQVKVAKAAPKPKPAKAAVSGSAKIHVVKPNETLYRVAVRYELSVDELRRLNRMGPEDTYIRPGQRLRVSG
jgi:membrane-bound lytic murein transglycosylase D